MSTFDVSLADIFYFCEIQSKTSNTDTYITVKTVKWDGDNRCYGIETA